MVRRIEQLVQPYPTIASLLLLGGTSVGSVWWPGVGAQDHRLMKQKCAVRSRGSYLIHPFSPPSQKRDDVLTRHTKIAIVGLPLLSTTRVSTCLANASGSG
jgi:hypothetical protein